MKMLTATTRFCTISIKGVKVDPEIAGIVAIHRSANTSVHDRKVFRKVGAYIGLHHMNTILDNYCWPF